MNKLWKSRLRKKPSLGKSFTDVYKALAAASINRKTVKLRIPPVDAPTVENVLKDALCVFELASNAPDVNLYIIQPPPEPDYEAATFENLDILPDELDLFDHRKPSPETYLKIIEHIRDEWKNAKEIADAMGKEFETVRAYCTRCFHEGLVTRSRKRDGFKYKVVEAKDSTTAKGNKE